MVANDDAVRQLDDALAHLVDDLGVVRGHDDGGAGAVDAIEQFHDADARVRVKVARRLIGDEDIRPVDEGPGDRDALLLTAGQFVGEALFLAVESDHLQDFRHDGLDVTAGLPDHLKRESHVLEHGLVRQQSEVLEHRADLATQLRHPPRRQLADVLAGHPDRAGCGPVLLQA